MRRGSAGAAADARRVPRVPGEARPPRARQRTGADAGVPARAAERGAARAERQQGRGPVGRRARGHPPAAEGVRRAGARAAGHHPAGHPQLHLPRHLEGVAPGGGRPGGPPQRRRGRRGPGGSGRGARPAGGLHGEPDGAREGRRARSADRADAGAAAHPPDPLPAAQEQPGVRRGRGCRQDGARRRARGPPDRAGDPGPSRRRRGVRARYGGAAGRHAVPGRLRGAVQGGHAGAGRSSPADPLHRRGARHGGRRGDHRRDDGPRDADQAGALRRRVAGHRVDDLRGVQAHREGPRTRPSPAEGGGRGADRRRDLEDPRRAAVALRGTSRSDVRAGDGAGRRPAGQAPPARLAPPGRSHRHHRRSGRDHRHAADRGHGGRGGRRGGRGGGAPGTENAPGAAGAEAGAAGAHARARRTHGRGGQRRTRRARRARRPARRARRTRRMPRARKGARPAPNPRR